MKSRLLFKRTGWVGLVLWLSLGVFIDPAYPIESHWRVQGGLGPFMVGGTIQVREFDITGTKLEDPKTSNSLYHFPFLVWKVPIGISLRI